MQTVQRLTGAERMRNRRKTSAIVHLFCVTICGFFALAMTSPVAAAEDGAVIWSITPYVWASATEFDLRADGSPIGGGSVSFSDLIDATDASFQVVIERGMRPASDSRTQAV